MTEETEKLKETPEAPTTLAEGQLERFSALADKILERTDITAKALAALGSSALTAIGIAEVTDVYPFEGPSGWLIGLFGGFLLMGAAFAFFTRRLWRLQTPMVMRSSPLDIKEIDDEQETDLIEEVYREIAKLNDVASLRAYEARAHRLSRVAARLSEPELAASVKAKAEQIEVEVRATMARARLNVVRQRAARSILGFRAMVGYVAFLVGLLTFGVAADALESERAGTVALAKSCGEATEAGATSLPEACDAFIPVADSAAGAEEDTTPEELVDSALDALASARTECRNAAREASVDVGICAAIDRALAGGLESP